MSQTVRFRRLAGAACLVIGPALTLIAFWVMPWQQSDGTTRDSLDLLGANLTATQTADLLAFAGILASIPAVLAIMHALRRGAPLLGLIGGSLAIAGYVSAMLVVLSDQMLVGLAERESVRPAAAAALDDSSAWVINVVLIVFLTGLFVGSVVLGAGLLRSRIVPAWAGVALIVSPVVGVVAHITDRKAIDVVGSVLGLVAFAAVARRVAATDDAAWERGEIAGQPENATTITTARGRGGADAGRLKGSA